MTSMSKYKAINEQKNPSPRKRRMSWGKMAAWVFLALWIILTLFPVYWIGRMAFSTQKQLLAHPTSLLPVEFTIDPFKRVFGLMELQDILDQGGFGKKMNFGLYLRNSILVTVISTTSATVFNAMAAYAFARLRFPLREKLFYAYLIVQIMPSVLGLIPNFILIHQLGWVGTLQGIIAPGFLGNAFGVFFLRQFFLSTNRELEDAAKLDGANLIGIFWRIIIPISIPALTTAFILSFVGSWNELQWAYFAGGAGRIEEATTLMVAMLSFQAASQTGLPDFTGLMAATLISIIPMLALFLVFGRRIVDAIQFSGIK